MSINPFDSPALSGHAPVRALSVPEMLFGFDGRISRMDFWGWSFFAGIAYGIVVFVVAVLFGASSDLTTLVRLALYVPLIWISLALGAKRWHDLGFSGWMVLIGLVPLVGAVVNLVVCGLIRGTVGPNVHGGDPT